MLHLKGHWNLVKNSFTLLETTIALVVVSYIISNIYLSTHNEYSLKTYKTLQSIENNYNKNNAIEHLNGNFSFK